MKTCCAENLRRRCPNCGGKLVRRPTRVGAAISKYPAAKERVFKPGGCASVKGEV
ncbi:MAG: DUF1272 domain-containing protein [Acidobacteria bacterium]|nr:DUF1272 domain-containing protein [Acidobacteriota bacterium]